MIEFNGLPVLGQDSSPQNSSKFFGIAGTVVFWALFVLISLFVKLPNQKPKYKEVKIVLSSTPAKTASAPSSSVEPVVTSAAPLVEPVVTSAVKQNAASPKPAAPSLVEPVETSNVKQKSAPAKTTPVAEQTYALDPMEAFANQTAKKTKKEFDWSQFDDEPEVSEQTQTTKTVQPAQNSFSGSAGTAAVSSNQHQTSESSNAKTGQTEVSSATSSALGKIGTATFTASAGSGVQSESSVRASSSGSGKVMMEMTDGTQRLLLDPSQPIINLSAAAAATIDGSKKVVITFTVVESGNVPYGKITISPASSFAQLVNDEICTQISQWRFEAADYTSTAKFEYKIVKQ